MIFLLYGSDTYRSRKKLNEIIAEYRHKNAGNFDFHKFDAEENNLASLKSVADAQSLFSQKKLIVVENIFAKSCDVDALAESIKSFAESKDVFIILWGREVGEADQKKIKILENLPAKTQEFKKKSGQVLSRWLQEETKKRGLKLYPAHLARFDALEGDLWAISNELDKIMVSGDGLGGDPASTGVSFAEKNVFDLSDTFFTSRRQGLSNLLQLFHQGEDDFKLFGFLVNHGRKILTIKNYAEKGQAIPAHHGIHPFVAKKAGGVIKNTPMKKITSFPNKFFEEDFKTKVGLTKHKEALINIVLEN